MKFIVIMMMALSFCSTVYAAPIGESDATIKLVADPAIENVINGLVTGDYTLFSTNFTSKLMKSVPVGRFENEVESLKLGSGKYIRHSYMGFINQASHTIEFYKAKFDQTANDVLLYIYLSKADDAVYVTGVRWFAHSF